jgi:type IV secretory pathway ATPase VirB11/archaellum biosynthesis ATPase
MIDKYIISKCLDEVLKRINRIIGTENAKYIISKKNIEDAIFFHSTQVENWSSEIIFKDLENPKSTRRTYVNLDVFLTPRRQIMSNQAISSPNKIGLDHLLKNDNRNLIILGQPGAGKTTSVKHICQLLLHEQGINNRLHIPVVIRLRELINVGGKSEESIIQKLFEILGLSVIIEQKIYINKKIETKRKNLEKRDIYEHKEVILRIITEILNELGVFLILDGLDEIPLQLRNQTLSEIKLISLSITNARFILTSRLGEFADSIENASEYEICPLNIVQIEKLTNKWLTNKLEGASFIQQLNNSPYADTAMRPLTLTHLLAIFEREKQIPEKPKSVYRKIVSLLLEEWDLQRAITRKSRYANFEIDRKHEFLSHMSYYLTIKYNKTIFSRGEFEEAYKEICENFDLPKYESKTVAGELETHNGLLIQISYDQYEFAHKSLQEYLVADHLVKLPFIPLDRSLLTIPNEIALSIAISSNPTNYFVSLIFHILADFDITTDFIKILFTRILVEKVDFNQHPILALSFLNLFTKQLEKQKKETKEILEVFRKIYSLNSFRSSLQKLNEFYKIGTDHFSEYENIFILENSKYMKNDIITDMPKKLYASDEFLYNWE